MRKPWIYSKKYWKNKKYCDMISLLKYDYVAVNANITAVMRPQPRLESRGRSGAGTHAHQGG